jgi:hypothetical protein
LKEVINLKFLQNRLELKPKESKTENKKKKEKKLEKNKRNKPDRSPSGRPS